MKELLNKSATEQGKLLAAGEFSSRELVDIYLERIARFDADLCAFTYVATQRARWAASGWDKTRKRGKAPAGPLSGVPTAIKDLAFVRGMPTRFGSRAVPPLIPARDGLVTKRVRRAGMIITGKLATAEFGAMPVTEPDIHGPTRNPYNLDYTAGGSSGGSGAAVAAQLLPIAQGSDGAGSIRIPSSLTGLVGLKTSRGLISHITPVDKMLRLAGVGGLARTTEDLAAFLDALADWPNDFFGEHRRDLPAGLRVAVSTENPICKTEPSYQAAATRVAALLESHGAQVQERPWIDIDPDLFLVLWQRLMANAPILQEGKLQPVTAWLRKLGKAVTKEDAVATRITLQRQVGEWFGSADLWVSPCVAIPPPKIGAWKAADPETSFRSVLGLGVYTAVFNVGGQPAISIPMGLDESGVPYGVQVAGRLGSDNLLLQVARAVEQELATFPGPPPGVYAT